MGCSGFIYGLNIASNLIKNNEGKNGLIICTDVYTKFIEKRIDPVDQFSPMHQVRYLYRLTKKLYRTFSIWN